MPLIDFLKKLFSVQEEKISTKSYVPEYWDSGEGEIIRAILLDGNQSWTRLQNNTGFDKNTLNHYLNKLLREGIIKKSNKYWVNQEVRNDYYKFYQDLYIKNNPKKNNLNILEEDVPKEDKVRLIDGLQSSNIRGVKKLHYNKQIFVDGRQLGLIAKDFIYQAKKEVLIMNPFVTDCNLTESIKRASAYKKIFLLTRPPEFEADFKFYEKTRCHTSLKESGVRLAYNPEIHAKIILCDRALSIVSSMNLYHDSSEGFTYEAGIITVDSDVVDYIFTSFKTVLRDERTGILF